MEHPYLVSELPVVLCYGVYMNTDLSNADASSSKKKESVCLDVIHTSQELFIRYTSQVCCWWHKEVQCWIWCKLDRQHVQYSGVISWGSRRKQNGNERGATTLLYWTCCCERKQSKKQKGKGVWIRAGNYYWLLAMSLLWATLPTCSLRAPMPETQPTRSLWVVMLEACQLVLWRVSCVSA